MPLVKFHVYSGWSQEGLIALLDVAHRSMVQSFQVPERDRYQIVDQHPPGTMIALDTGLDIPRTDRFVMVEVISRPRTVEQKRTFYADLSRHLHQECGVLPSDLMVSFVENTDADWSFGHGRAQFLTKEL
ncbi:MULTISPECIES: tautomerase family protein [unclassified Mesorhizobium]|uniref:tautomerase family protein n=1 Tax=unclassified Mesorhizobium TaxID=325217 RepID=UPI0024151452|nr:MULTISPECIES: tautomerase family protein [unclassified Mesorhizobium]MDG4889965.1 tautomerase family protein [Mesorhizobium sp. WSM4887]MDG4904108.1 tautomerase family protein [Mesorhizobium sp. WSM4962]MDG4909135.1 tautomerase family protein [Mesorhizobium sp. WSM4898]MDG4921759.1 tautomerase family protein [Mesorhizobium sp. WSM4989]